MKSARNILLLIGGIFSVIAALVVIATGVFTIVLGSPAFEIVLQEASESGAFTTDLPDLASLQAFLTMFGVIFLISSLLAIACAASSFAARKKENNGLYVACIVLGFLSGGYLSLIGGVIGVLDTGNDRSDK